MVIDDSFVIHYCNRYNRGVADEKERARLKNELMQEILCNLLYVNGPMSWSSITYYFGTTTGKKGSKLLRENLKVLTDENWGPDQLIKTENRRYVINDSWGPEPPVKFENGRYRYVISDPRKDE